ncbi:hypothetical protein [Bradyrhizobium sp. 186]|uniref:hypothetical protein n=1 Tax=Bradyrhizobium sp. 186 TaxID=2782654 RepID=UPI0020006ABB|nr:hypothetical protein [Bradyrhizobium sp. 186]
MIRQDHDCMDGESSFGASHAECVAKFSDMIDQRGRSSIIQRYGEEEGPAGDKIAPIANHVRAFPDYASLHPGYNQIARLAMISLT